MGDENTVEVPDFGPLLDAIKGIGDKFEAFASIPEREKIKSHQLKVNEQLPYRFDGTKDSGFDFSTDLISGMFNGSGEARVRLEKFLQSTNFAAVATGDVNELNPTPTRTDLYVDQIQPGTPVLDSLQVLPLSDSTPFIVPKFSSATNYVADHVEDTEPAAVATFVTTSQTVTPTAVSGYGEISREVVDAGGNPAISALLWTQFQREYVKALEVKAAAFMNALVITELGTVLDSSDEVITPGHPRGPHGGQPRRAAVDRRRGELLPRPRPAGHLEAHRGSQGRRQAPDVPGQEPDQRQRFHGRPLPLHGDRRLQPPSGEVPWERLGHGLRVRSRLRGLLALGSQPDHASRRPSPRATGSASSATSARRC